MTFAEYIAFEESAEERHEFENGRIYSMAGGTPEHAALASALHLLVGRQLTGTCRSFVENLRIRTPSGKTAYPDMLVICGPITRDAEDKNTITNPQVIFEVLSEGTEGYDRGKKFAHYRSCPSFVEYVLVASQGEPRVERFVKNDGVWTIAEDAIAGQKQRLASIDVVIDVDELYRGLVDSTGAIALA